MIEFIKCRQAECLAGSSGLKAYELEATNDVDLTGSTFYGPVHFSGARIEGCLYCNGTVIIGTRCNPAVALLADGIRVGRDVELNGGFTADGAVRFAGARIAARLYCTETRILGQDESGLSLVADGLKVGRGVFLEDDFITNGAIRLTGAEISGRLSLRKAKLRGKDLDENSLNADRVKIGARAFLDKGFKARGCVSFLGAEIAGRMICDGGRFGRNSDGVALNADGIKVHADLLFSVGFSARGALRLTRAEVDGKLLCAGGKFLGKDRRGSALIADGIRVGSSVIFNENCEISGAVRLIGAIIGGQVNFRHASIVGSDDDHDALILDEARISASVLLDQGFTVQDGAVNLSNTQISGHLYCGSAKFHGINKKKDSFKASHSSIKGDLLLNDGFEANGIVRCTGARVQGRVNCGPAVLRSSGGDEPSFLGERIDIGGNFLLESEFVAEGAVLLERGRIRGSLVVDGAEFKGLVALRANGLRVDHEFIWRPRGRVTGLVDLDRTSVHQLTDDLSTKEGCWPSSGKLVITGFAYESFGGAHLADVGERLNWIRKGSGATKGATIPFSVQPYRHLERVYRSSGQDVDAQKVAISRRNDFGKFGTRNLLTKLKICVLYRTIKHGYEPMLALRWLILLYVFIAMLLLYAKNQDGVIVPTRPATISTATELGVSGSAKPGEKLSVTREAPIAPKSNKCPGVDYPCFNPLIYAIDVVAPIVNLGQADSWRINGGASKFGTALVFISTAATILGWAFTTLFVVGFSGVIRRE